MSEEQIQTALGAAVAVAVVSDTSIDRQKSLASETSREVLQSVERSEDRAMEAKLQRMSEHIAGANNLGGDWTVYLLNDGTPNAMTPGGGDIFVNTGLIAFTETEAQMAMILAHEMAHSHEGHVVENIRDSTLIGIAAVLLGERLGGDAQQIGVELGTSAVLAGYSRGAEREADDLGFEYLVRAGYHPAEAAKPFLRFDAAFGSTDNLSHFFTGTHPHSKDRAASMAAKAAQVEARGIANTAEFSQLTAKYR
ncbi:MAG: M48 family metallopeptidase [Pseudomonadota bacterium]